MSDWQSLYLIVCALYLLERVLWLPPPGVVFQRTILGKWRLVRDGWDLAAFGVRAFLSPCLPPFGRVLVCEDPQVGVSPRGFWLIADTDSDQQEDFESRYFRFTDALRIESQGNKLKNGGKTLARFSSPASARHAAAFLAQLSKTGQEQRARLIETEHQRSLACELVRENLSASHRGSRKLLWPCAAQFLLLFLVFPVLAQVSGLRAIWIPVLGCVVLCGIYIARAFHRAHKALHGTSDEERGRATATFLLSPVAAVCAADEVQKHAAGIFHPLAITAVLCDREVFEANAGRALRYLLYPLPFLHCALPDEFRQEVAWFRQQWQRAVEKFIADTVDDPTRLLAAPQKEAEECLSYCPRCGSQFVFPEGQCSECLLTVVRFVETAESVAGARSQVGGTHATRVGSGS